MSNEAAPPSPAGETLTLLLAQLGTQAAYRFAQELRELGLLPAPAGILKVLGSSARISQRALGRKLSITNNRIHELAHELEDKGLVERRSMPGDLRAPHVASHCARRRCSSVCTRLPGP